MTWWRVLLGLEEPLLPDLLERSRREHDEAIAKFEAEVEETTTTIRTKSGRWKDRGALEMSD